ncbi:unnamed protein product [Owenia fusiformis]|uniref:EF-hand domain-containing protein n=1 Tax=Owenia fusiformis TaxID=6347 RepID=A0A8S4PGB2_OWEFU|nr:unnamed protein product [Owenia fusiformis]
MEEQEPLTDDAKVAAEETPDTFHLTSKITLSTGQPSFQAILDEVDAELASLDEHEHDKKKLEPKTYDLSDLENNSEWDTDLEDEDERVEYDVTGKTLYMETCKELGVVPVSYFLRHMNGEDIKMKHHGLGPLGAKALAVPLVTNTNVLTLDLEDNGLEGDGGVYIADMLKENCYITELTLSYNKLGSLGGCAMCEMLLQNITVTKMSLAGNEFTDKDADYFAKAILENQTLREFDLSHNQFSEDGGLVLSYAIGENETLESLDLSWNHLRGNGAIAICDGVKNNARLKHFNIAWNGLGNTGALAVAEILKFNRTLTTLDITSNRITTEGAIILAKGIDPNETLKTFKMGLNPIGTMGALLMLNGINNDRSIMDTLDISNILIDKEFKKIHDEMIENGRNLVVIHGGLIGNYVIKGTPKINVELGSMEDLHRLVTKKSSALDDFLKNDPMAILKAYVEKRQLRLVDFFNQFDKDKNFKISMDEFKRGIVMANIGLTAEQVETLLHRLDSSGVSDKDGMIDYSCLVDTNTKD